MTNRVEVTDPRQYLVLRSDEERRLSLHITKSNKVTRNYQERRLSFHSNKSNKVTRNLHGLVVQQVAPTITGTTVAKFRGLTVQQLTPSITGQSIRKAEIFIWPGSANSVGTGFGVLDVRKLINHTGNTEFGIFDKG